MRRLLTVVGAATILTQLLLAPGFGRDQNHVSPTPVLLPGAITGVGSHGPIGYWRLCEPISIGLNEWRIGFIEQLLKLGDAQKELSIIIRGNFSMRLGRAAEVGDGSELLNSPPQPITKLLG